MPSSSRRITASALLTFSTSIGMESLGRCRCHMFRGRVRCRTSEIHSQDQPGSGSLKVFLDLEGTCYLLKVMIFHDIISLCASNILRSTLKGQTIDCDSSRITKGWSDSSSLLEISWILVESQVIAKEEFVNFVWAPSRSCCTTNW